MECPKCKKKIGSLQKKCSSCSYEYDKNTYEKIALYFDMQEELRGLNIFKDFINSKIKSFTEKINIFEKILTFDLKQIAKELSALHKKETSEIKAKPQKNVKPTVKTTAKKAASEMKIVVESPKKKSAPVSSKNTITDLELNLGQKWILGIGIISTIFGIGYFLKYSFEQGWIGPLARVSLAYFLGVVFMLSGKIFSQKDYKNFGLSIMGGGVAIFYSSTYAAYQSYGLLNSVAAFVVMILITVGVCWLAVSYDNRWLAVLSTIGGFLTPAILSTGQNNYQVLFIYMFILNAGVLRVAYSKKWEVVSLTGFVFTFIMYAGWFAEYYQAKYFWAAIVAFNAYYLIYTIIPFLYQRFAEKSDSLKEFILVTPTALLGFIYNYIMIEEYFGKSWVSLITLGYAMLYLALSYYLFKAGKKSSICFIAYFSQAMIFVIITAPLLFSGNVLTIMWILTALAIQVVAHFIDNRLLVRIAYILLSVVILKLFVSDYPLHFKYEYENHIFAGGYFKTFTARVITLLISFAALFFSGFWARKHHSMLIMQNIKDHAIIFVVWGAALFFVLNFETASYFTEYFKAAFAVSMSILWALYAICLMITGFKFKNSPIRKTALVLLIITVLKVFFADMEKIATPYRIISFIVLGLVLIGISFLYHKYKDKFIKI